MNNVQAMACYRATRLYMREDRETCRRLVIALAERGVFGPTLPKR